MANMNRLFVTLTHVFLLLSIYQNTHTATPPQALNNFSRKQPMKRFDQQCLRDYVMDGFRDTGHGIELKCAPESESHTYMAGYETYERNINNQLKEIKW